MNLAMIGTGYVGLVTGTCLAETGNHVICVDNDLHKLEKLDQAELPIYEPGLDMLFYRNIAKKRLTFTGDLKTAVLNSEIIFLCLPTPQGDNGAADLRYVLGVAHETGKILKEAGGKSHKLIVNKSTVPVGTSAKVAEILKEEGALNFDVVSNPEFLKEGAAIDDFMKPDRVVIGTDNVRTAEIMKELYDPFMRKQNRMIVMDIRSAEMTKYAANAMLATRISFMNQIANLCDLMGADVAAVREGIGSDSRIGYDFLFPGPGYGGSCFPKDVKALIRTAEECDYDFLLLKAVEDVNERQKEVLAHKLVKVLGSPDEEQPLTGRTVACWGLAFKPRTDDMREAPAITIIERLLAAGATVRAHDPEAIKEAKKVFGDRIEYSSNQYAILENADALAIITDWSEYRNPDFDRIKAALKNPLVVDGRNLYKPDRMSATGFSYIPLGRCGGEVCGEVK